MTGGSLVYEIGKYGSCAVLFLAMTLRGFGYALLPLTYFAVLTFSVPLTIAGQSPERARQLISADLSGPFSLMMAVCFFMQLTLQKQHYHRWLLAIIVPLPGILTLAWHSILTASSLTFHTDSNFVTSGGFGPNQVSAILGLGALLAFFVSQDCESRVAKWTLLGAIPVLVGQSMLTFSRTGFYLALASGTVAAAYLLKQRGQRVTVLFATSLAVMLTWFVILPRLDTFTGGNLSARFQDTDLSGRESLFWQEVEIWLTHPLVGVGPGMSASFHVDYLTRSHTEFSRLLAEHGMLGILAIVLLLVMARRAWKRSRGIWHRARVASFITWVILFMCASGMRLVVPAFLLGLALARRDLDSDELEVEDLELDLIEAPDPEPPSLTAGGGGTGKWDADARGVEVLP
jgi:hypothetical protein